MILSSLDKTASLNEHDGIEMKQNDKNKEITNESDTKTIAFDDKFDVLKQNEEVKEDVNNIEEKIENNEELKEIVVKPLTPNKLRKPVKVSPVAPKHIPLKDLVDDSEVIDLESSDKND